MTHEEEKTETEIRGDEGDGNQRPRGRRKSKMTQERKMQHPRRGALSRRGKRWRKEETDEEEGGGRRREEEEGCPPWDEALKCE